MAGVSNYLADLILNTIFRDGTFTQPPNLYVALFTTMPANDGTGGVEVTGTGYARVAVPTTNTGWSAPAANALAREITNAAAVDYGTAGSDWAPSASPVVGFGFYDALTAGNYWGGNPFGSNVIVQNGNPVRFTAGSLRAQLVRPS